MRMLCFILTMTAAAYSLGEAQSTTDAQSEIEGTITVSPALPGPIRPGIPSSKPLANTTFVVQTQNGVATEFTTDGLGRFHVSVAPGHYTVSLKESRGRIGRFGPFEVDVAPGQTAKVEWQCDSGMR
jgi:hypothetical protein